MDGYRDPETVADALDVLGDLPEWELSAARWEEVARVLAAMQAALADGDATALAETVADLELLSPTRITRIGATPTVPAPEPVRERANQLEHTLVTSRQPSRPHPYDAEAGTDDEPSARR